MDYLIWLKKFLAHEDIYTRMDLEMSHSYNNKLEQGIYISENIDLKNQKALERYNKFVKIILTKNPKDYQVSDFKHMESYINIEYFKELVHNIFGNNNDINYEIISFIENMQITNNTNPMNGQAYELLDPETNKRSYHLLIPDMENECSAVCLLHEFIHYHYIINNLNHDKKFYYQEILSIFGEKYAAYQIEGKGSSTISNKVENIRLDVIKYHNTVRLDDAIYTRKAALKYSNDYLLRFSKEYKKYAKAIVESYTLGYIYAESLFQLYINDKQAHDDINNLIIGNNSFNSILNKYNITLENKEIVETAKKKVRTIFK